MKFSVCSSQRHPTRRALVQGLSALLLVPAWQTAHAQMATSAALNRTAHFRALSQRIAKAYCQVHLKVLPVQSRNVLETAQKLVHSGFADLDKVAWSDELALQLAEVKKMADALDALLVLPPTKNSVAAVSLQADKMLLAAEAATQGFEKLSKTSTARLVNTAGRQRMLSQRMAKNYGLAAAGFDHSSVTNQMISDAVEFKQAMAILAAAPISSPGIRQELGLGESQWVFFDAALQRKPDARGLEAVATTSERLLEIMEKLTGQYELALKEIG